MATQTDEQKAKAEADVKTLEALQATDEAAAEAHVKAEADAQQAAEEAARPADETVAGGRYVVNGVTVDANGIEIKGN